MGLVLDGILYRALDPAGGEPSDITVIHVHGSLGNFYSNEFVRVLAGVYQQTGVNFLSFNLSAHDGLAEGSRGEDDVFEYVGGSVCLFDECVSDVWGAVDFVDGFSKTVFLQGHSLGCNRVVHFLRSSEVSVAGAILLSPCDSYRLQSRWRHPETVEEQIQRIEQGSHDEFGWLDIEEYGVREADWSYFIPITKRAFLSIAKGPGFEVFRSGHVKTPRSSLPVLCYIGGKDPLMCHPAMAMFDHIRCLFDPVHEVFSADGGHMLEGCERMVGEEVVSWISHLQQRVEDDGPLG